MKMHDMTKELKFLILQFLDDENHKETVHKLEQESGIYFNIKYFSELVRTGEWDAAYKYVSGFTKYEDNKYSMKILYEIQKQKYLEALDRNDCAKAVDILRKDLKAFLVANDQLYKDLTQLLALEDFRTNEQLASYGDTDQAREVLLKDLKRLVQLNPLLNGKLQFPTVMKFRLKKLIDQSLNWQHHFCSIPKQNPDIQTLYTDHSCSEPHFARDPSPRTDNLKGVVSRVANVPHTAASAPFHPTPAQFEPTRSGWTANLPLASVGYRNVVPFSNNPGYSAMLRHPVTPNYLVLQNQTAEPGHVLKRPRVLRTSNKDSSMAVNMVPMVPGGHNHVHKPISTDDLPNKVIMTLNQGSSVESMDFHSVQQLLLLVGTSIGDTEIWDIATRKNLAVRKFKVWGLGAHSMALQASLVVDNTISTNRVKWSPEGLCFGVAFSKNIVQIYDYQGEELRNRLEIEAHSGSVNDIAFTYPKNKLAFITCGDDKVIKVWDAVTGANLYSFVGHLAPVYSVCPHEQENIPYLFSSSTDGKIKVWLYDNLGSRIDYSAPAPLRMAYSADGTRLFCCGTNKHGKSHLVEWSESKGVVQHSYRGFGKQSLGVVQFDIAKNRFLAVGDESVIKFWDVDQLDVLTTTDADGGLQASPCLKFNEKGTLLAVSTADSGIKILANGDGIRQLPAIENCTVDQSSAAAAATIDENSSITEVNEASECRSQMLPDNALNNRIARLIYTNSGVAILALASNGVHILWRWPVNERNPNGRATTRVVPQQMLHQSGVTMVNEIGAGNPAAIVSCFALSNNDSYVISASGGQISLYNLRFQSTAKIMAPPPPAATYLAFHPEDSNIIAVGMDDSSIHIYNIQTGEIKAQLCRHLRRISGLAFSTTLMLLVSVGADFQLCAWRTDGWEHIGSNHLQIPPGRMASPFVGTHIQFHEDQMHLLVVHESQISIYSAAKLEFLKQWMPPWGEGNITHATYSCDSESIYVSFDDGSVGVLTSSNLILRCRINPNSYMPANPNRGYPVVIAAHPAEPNQFALGLTDGGVIVLEPKSSEGQWGTASPT